MPALRCAMCRDRRGARESRPSRADPSRRPPALVVVQEVIRPDCAVGGGFDCPQIAMGWISQTGRPFLHGALIHTDAFGKFLLRYALAF